jgi:putative oxidoreductase
MLQSIENKLAAWAPYAPIFIRVAFGYHLIQYTYADVFGGTAGNNAAFLTKVGVPFPFLMAWVYILTEFLGGVAWVVGFKVRWFSAALVINFIVALLLVHVGDTYKHSFEAIHMLCVSLFLLFNGAGKLSIDAWLQSRQAPATTPTIAGAAS